MRKLLPRMRTPDGVAVGWGGWSPVSGCTREAHIHARAFGTRAMRATRTAVGARLATSTRQSVGSGVGAQAG
eukprot:5739275-Pleurochrysis_carterae.AAC.1